MYAKCGMLENAQKTFDELAVQNVVSWTTLITGYAQNGSGEKALYCFEQMRRDDLSPNESTFSCILKACGAVGDFWKGCEVHVEIMKAALLERDIVIANALVDMYAKCGDMVKAQTVFNELSVPDVVSWSTLISGYAQHLHYEQALCCFECMKLGGVSPNIITCVSILSACGRLGAFSKGQGDKALYWFEAMEKNQIHYDGTAVVDMYAKCGMLENAQKTFDELAVQNVVSWTALITGYAQNGSGEKALYCFEQMRRDVLSPNESTFSCILKTCGAVGGFWKGCEVHVEIMKAALLERDIVIANALVDIYAKCGDMVKAQTVFNELSVPDVVSWSTLISGYAQHLH
ncbi:hypothetical protein KP509_18G010100 [Ceratopteris richardii]|uniref:Pentatricopeptide repeat-containing protein n=1 Tax=Ceratopteris richardii TaxID=49495 RepID=A0A8T2SP31_CERRI|nr:hypothetical protein KP509_18G010100 [Ceratopteris richardii]